MCWLMRWNFRTIAGFANLDPQLRHKIWMISPAPFPKTGLAKKRFSLLAWSETGLAKQIEKGVQDAEALAHYLANDARTILKQHPETGVLNWHPVNRNVDDVLQSLGQTSSQTKIDGEIWLRQVAANPNADITKIWTKICAAL
jgi:hypothetical protein